MTVRRPKWLIKKAPSAHVLTEIETLLDGLSLHTVCESARCPNIGECFARHTATFLLMGDICTRNCSFCAVKKERPFPLDPDEPGNVVQAVKKLGLRHVVLTSVTRDDLPDGGAHHFAGVVGAIHSYDPQVTVEVLIPDFQGSLSALEVITTSHPAIINHNVETVPHLYPQVRPQADYQRSLKLLKQVKSLAGDILTKSGLMVGLGERCEEVIQVMADLREVGCDLLTIGQYLRPSINHHEVVRFVPPQEFEEYRDIAVKMGFKSVASAPYVRSSFQADRMLQRI
ncbi:lipoyl synthase [Chloroflexota bacterium]